VSDSYFDPYEAYEERFDPLLTDRQARKARKPKAKHTPKKAQDAILSELADETAEMEGDFKTTYRPSRYEAGWLMESLGPLFQQELITDVLALVRGGKEASVYRCAAHPNTGQELLAAKVYRPRKFRQLRNDKLYREGRSILSVDGEDLNQSLHNDRVMRAVGKKTDYGKQVMHTSWLMHEYTTLERLYRLGANVPQPIAVAENAILMGYCGDADLAAPVLN
jgi:RIO kinase 1